MKIFIISDEVLNNKSFEEEIWITQIVHTNAKKVKEFLYLNFCMILYFQLYWNSKSLLY